MTGINSKYPNRQGPGGQLYLLYRLHTILIDDDDDDDDEELPEPAPPRRHSKQKHRKPVTFKMTEQFTQARVDEREKAA